MSPTATGITTVFANMKFSSLALSATLVISVLTNGSATTRNSNAPRKLSKSSKQKSKNALGVLTMFAGKNDGKTWEKYGACVLRFNDEHDYEMIDALAPDEKMVCVGKVCNVNLKAFVTVGIDLEPFTNSRSGRDGVRQTFTVDCSAIGESDRKARMLGGGGSPSSNGEIKGNPLFLDRTPEFYFVCPDASDRFQASVRGSAPEIEITNPEGGNNNNNYNLASARTEEAGALVEVGNRRGKQFQVTVRCMDDVNDAL